ncbi:MAG: Kelch repeat-containing protein [Planctomycetota bacterium]
MRHLLNFGLLASTLATSVPAQGSFELDKVTNGEIGRTLNLDFHGAPVGASLLFMFSVGSGPIPLAAIDPADPRSLALDLEFAGTWRVAHTGTGAGSLALPIPNAMELAGGLLHMQALTFPGTSLVVGALSNPVTQQLGIVGTPVALPRNLLQARAQPHSFRAGRDIVIAGGGRGTMFALNGLSSTERYDARTMQVTAGPPMHTAHSAAFSTVLLDGSVLIAGGVDSTGAVLSSAEIYDPQTDQFTPAGSLIQPLAVFDGTLLNDGRVLIAGGTTSLVDAPTAYHNARWNAAIYDYETDRWLPVASMPDRLLGHDLTTLADGRVLVSGGFLLDYVPGAFIPMGSTRNCHIYDPTTDTWTRAASMNYYRGGHSSNTVRLQDGRVLVTGGAQCLADLSQAYSFAGAEYYDPSTDTWTRLPPLPRPTAFHAVSLLADGRVVITGGAGGTLANPVEHAGVLLFDPQSNSFTSLPDLPSARAWHTSMTTDDGVVVLFGGQDGGGTNLLATTVTIRL